MATKFLIRGKSNYAHLSKPNKNGKFGIGVAEIENILVNSDENIEEMRAFFKDNFVSNGVCQFENSKFPIKVQTVTDESIEGVRLSNGFPIDVIVSLKYNKTHKKYYCVVDGVKLLDEYKPFNAFNDIEFE